MPRGDGSGPAGSGQGRGQGQGRGRRGGGGFAGGPGGECVCLQCGKTMPHERGVPCVQQTCPQCGVPLTRKM